MPTSYTAARQAIAPSSGEPMRLGAREGNQIGRSFELENVVSPAMTHMLMGLEKNTRCQSI